MCHPWLNLLFFGAVITVFSPHVAARTDKVPTEYELMYDKLLHLRADELNVATVNNLVLTRDAGSFRLHQGKLYACTPIDGRIPAALFVGNGTFSMKPPTKIEQDQLLRFFEQDSIEKKFTLLFALFADSTREELERVVRFQPGTVGGADDMLQYCLKYLSDDDTKFFHKDFMQTFLHHERNTLFHAHFSEQRSQPYFFGINPFEEEEVSFSQRGESNVSYYQELITKFHTRQEYQSGTAGNSEEKNRIQVNDYRIDAGIADNLKFSASSTMIFQSRVDNLKWIPLTLYSKLDVDTAYWNSQGAAVYFRGEESSVLWIQAMHPLARNEVCSLTVRYRGDLLEKDELGWIGLQSSSTWYPRYGYRQRAGFDLRFHTPSRWKFASVGKRQSMESGEDTLFTQWKTIRPTHNVSFGIGSFKEIVIDEEGSAEGKKDSLPNVTVLEFEFAPKGYGLSDLGEEVRGDLLNCVRFFQHVYGKSPVEDLYAMETPYFHGEAFPGLVHLSWTTYKYVDENGGNEIFRAHEVAHQWWGVGVNFRTYHDQWLSEAFSDYSGLWYMQAALKDNEKFFDALDKMKERILSNRKFLFGSGQESGPIWLGYRTQSSQTKGDYDLIVYKKGAWVVHMLRNMMIDLGTMNEDKFKNMMREFYSLYLGKEASTGDFQHVVEKYMGVNMDWFFQQWVMGTKIPEYSFSYSTTATPDGKFKTLCRVTQQNVPKEFVMPIPLLVKFEDGRYVRLRMVFSGEKQEYELPLLPFKPEEIVFNDLNSVLCEVNYENWR